MSEINEEVFPDKIGELVTVQHFWQCEKSDLYEKNPKSTAQVLDNGKHYFQGCFWGGNTKDIVEMMRILDSNIKIDLKNRIIAQWYDESHMNRYLYDHPPKELSMAYAYPGRDTKKYPVNPIIIHYNYGSI